MYGDSYSRLSSDIDKADRLLFSNILVLALLPMLIDYVNGWARARALGIAVQIKIMREASLVLIDLWFVIYLWMLLEKCKIVSWKKKEFEDLKDCILEYYFLDFIF
jgi:hypothetical protein